MRTTTITAIDSEQRDMCRFLGVSSSVSRLEEIVVDHIKVESGGVGEHIDSTTPPRRHVYSIRSIYPEGSMYSILDIVPCLIE